MAYTKDPACAGIPFVIGVKVSTDKPGQHQGVLEVCASVHPLTSKPISQQLTVPFSINIKEVLREAPAGRNILTKQQIAELVSHRGPPAIAVKAVQNSQILKVA